MLPLRDVLPNDVLARSHRLQDPQRPLVELATKSPSRNFGRSCLCFDIAPVIQSTPVPPAGDLSSLAAQIHLFARRMSLLAGLATQLATHPGCECSVRGSNRVHEASLSLPPQRSPVSSRSWKRFRPNRRHVRLEKALSATPRYLVRCIYEKNPFAPILRLPRDRQMTMHDSMGEL